MPAIASIVIQVDEKGAVQAFNRLDAAGKQVKLEDVGIRGTKAMEAVGSSTEKARQSMQLLTNITGVQMPRALEQILSKAPGVQSALNAAFAATVVITLAKQIVNLVDQLTGYSEQLAKIQQQSQEILQSVGQANTILRGPQTLLELHNQIQAAEIGIRKLNQQLGLTGDVFHDSLVRGLTRYNAANALLLDQLDQAKKSLNDMYLEQAKLVDQQRRTDPVTILQLENEARSAGLEGIAKIRAEDKGRVAEAIAGGKAVAQNELVTQAQKVLAHANAKAQIVAIERSMDDDTRKLAEQAVASRLKGIELVKDQEADALAELSVDRQRALRGVQKNSEDEYRIEEQFAQRKLSLQAIYESQRAQIERQAAEQTRQLDEDAAVAAASPWNRANAQIQVDAERRIRAIEQALQDSTISEAQAAQQIRDVWVQTFAQMRDNLAGQLESLFDDITSGNIGKRFLDQFKKLVFEMIASWALGLRQMQTQTAGAFSGGGGLLGSIFTGVLGIGGIGGFGGSGAQQIGPGGTSGFAGRLGNLFGDGGLLGSLFGGGSAASGASGGLASLPLALSANQLSNLAGLGLSAGGGIGTGTVLPAGASAAIGGGRFAGLLSAGPGLALLGAAGLFGLAGKAGPFGGAALGALGGLLGTGGLIAAFPALLGVLGAATLGIGALIGGLVGLFGGLFGNSKRQRAVEQLGQQVKDQITQIENAYNTHLEDATSAISQLESLRTTAHAQMHKLGGDTRTRVEQPIDAAESYINQTEAERARRAAIQFGPAEFHTGGLVRGGPAAIGGRPSFHSGGEINANLLIGEGVVNRRGMALLGEGGLNALNSGSGSGHTFNLNIQAIDAKSFASFLNNGGAVLVARAVNAALREGRI